MRINDFQKHMDVLYGEKDRKRGAEKTSLWLVSEVGELCEAVRKMDLENAAKEIADVQAWLCSLGNVLGISVQEATLQKYKDLCPRCQKSPCLCEEV